MSGKLISYPLTGGKIGVVARTAGAPPTPVGPCMLTMDADNAAAYGYKSAAWDQELQRATIDAWDGVGSYMVSTSAAAAAAAVVSGFAKPRVVQFRHYNQTGAMTLSVADPVSGNTAALFYTADGGGKYWRVGTGTILGGETHFTSFGTEADVLAGDFPTFGVASNGDVVAFHKGAQIALHAEASGHFAGGGVALVCVLSPLDEIEAGQLWIDIKSNDLPAHPVEVHNWCGEAI